MSQAKYSIILTTTETPAQAEQIAKSLLEKKLAACIQVQTIKSYYIWENKSCNSDECLLLIKTASDKYAAIEKHLKSIHPYKLPEIIELPITAGSAEYFNWISNSIETNEV